MENLKKNLFFLHMLHNIWGEKKWPLLERGEGVRGPHVALSPIFISITLTSTLPPPPLLPVIRFTFHVFHRKNAQKIACTAENNENIL